MFTSAGSCIRGPRRRLQITTKHRHDVPTSRRVVRIADTTTRPVRARTEHVSDHARTSAQERADHVQPARRAHDERITRLLVKKTPDAAGFCSLAQREYVHNRPIDRRVNIRDRGLKLRSDCRRGQNRGRTRRRRQRPPEHPHRALSSPPGQALRTRPCRTQRTITSGLLTVNHPHERRRRIDSVPSGILHGTLPATPQTPHPSAQRDNRNKAKRPSFRRAATDRGTAGLYAYHEDDTGSATS